MASATQYETRHDEHAGNVERARRVSGVARSAGSGGYGYGPPHGRRAASVLGGYGESPSRIAWPPRRTAGSRSRPRRPIDRLANEDHDVHAPRSDARGDTIATRSRARVARSRHAALSRGAPIALSAASADRVASSRPEPRPAAPRGARASRTPTRIATAIAGTNVANPSAYPGLGLTQSSTGSSQITEKRGRSDRQRHEQRDEVVQPDDRAQGERCRDGAGERARRRHRVAPRATPHRSAPPTASVRTLADAVAEPERRRHADERVAPLGLDLRQPAKEVGIAGRDPSKPMTAQAAERHGETRSTSAQTGRSQSTRRRPSTRTSARRAASPRPRVRARPPAATRRRDSARRRRARARAGSRRWRAGRR